MKALFGMMVVDGRGKLGGHVLSKNKGGAYARTKVTPINPQSVAQNTVRNRLTGFSQAWRGLTQSERNAWNGAGADFTTTDQFGKSIVPSGIDLYVKLNSNLDQVGVAAISSPPLPAAVSNVITLAATPDIGAGQFFITFTPDPVPADTAFIIDATRQLSPGVNFVKNEYRFLTFSDAAAISPNDIFTLYQARFGALTAGQKIGIRMTPINKITGQKGLGLTVNSIVIP